MIVFLTLIPPVRWKVTLSVHEDNISKFKKNKIKRA